MTEAIVLVGGFGTRLRPLTERIPKPMLPIAGVPFVAHQIARARGAGVDHVVLATSYLPEVFAEALGDGSRLGVDLEYETEQVPLGTGGAVRNAASRLRAGSDDPIFVFNGDVLDGHDLMAQLAEHMKRQADVTLYLTCVEDARPYGCVPTDEAGHVTAFLEKMPEPVTDQVNAGCYVFRRAVIDDIPLGRQVSLEREIFPGFLEAGRVVHSYVDLAYWLDIGTPAAYVRGSADSVLGRVDAPARPGPPAELLVLPGASVAADARVFGGTTVGVGARVGAGAVVEGSVLLDGALVGPGARIHHSVVGRETTIGARVVVENATVGDRCVVDEENELRSGVRIAGGTRLPPRAVRFSGT